MFKEDWVMRQVESIVNFLTMAVLKKKAPGYELTDIQNNSAADRLHEELVGLIREQKVNEAENLLFDRLDPKDSTSLGLAVDFYSRLNRMDDQTLEGCGFSREEIKEGLEECAARCGVRLSDLFGA